MVTALFCAALLSAVLGSIANVHATVTSSGDISPVPSGAGGNVVGPFRIGNVDVGMMSITGGAPLTNSQAAILGDTVTGIGIVNMSSFSSEWTLTSAGGDMTVANHGTGSLILSNIA